MMCRHGVQADDVRIPRTKTCRVDVTIKHMYSVDVVNGVLIFTV